MAVAVVAVRYIPMAAVMALMMPHASVATVVALPTATTVSVIAAMAATVDFSLSPLDFLMPGAQAETTASATSTFVVLNA